EKMEKYSSIFDAASKIERKKAVEKALSDEDASKAEKLPLLTNEEIAEKLEQYHKLHNFLADTLEQAFVKNNLSPKKLREYFSTSKNFSDEQWRLIQSERENIEGMLSKLLPSQLTKGEPSTQEKTKQKKPSKMQVKSRWMPMH
ncbi:MAG: hypothetical protein JSS12_08350, partial [Verrucomicrobia bacterium]|nr:hypothetical protein [Verrucomicrobiota bacterium]